MASLRSRQEARQRVLSTMLAALDRIIPEDNARPLKGSIFAEWEDQADAFKQAVIPTLLEERAALEQNAQVEEGGHCPFCGSDAVYLEKQTTHPELHSPDGPVVIENSIADAVIATVLFPPQNRDWALPAEANLTPHAAERICREAAQKSFEESARSLNLDWKTSWDGKQIQRWAEAFGDSAVRKRDTEVLQYKQGRRPSGPANEPQLLVIGVDGGRYQSREKDAKTQSRWREDKVGTVTSYIPGDGTEENPPRKLVTTHVATARDAEALGYMIRVEAERRGVRQAERVTLVADCANWIDPLHEKHFPCHQRIADFEHAAEHLWDAARAAVGTDSPAVPRLEGRWETLLYNGKVQRVIELMREEAAKLGELQQEDGEHHPRRVLTQEIGYFERNKPHMNYPEYRSKGWPIGSGNTEAGVKQFNKRIKGTEQFWGGGIEAMLALRALWKSQDQRWEAHWGTRPGYKAA